MSNVNTVAISGNAVADPELKIVGNDVAICNLRVASNRSKKTEEGYVDVASYFDVTVIGNYAKLVDSKVRKGDALVVTGRLEQQRWETEGGENRSKVVIIADALDGACFFKKADDVKAKESGTATSAPAGTASPAAADDDIPF